MDEENKDLRKNPNKKKRNFFNRFKEKKKPRATMNKLHVIMQHKLKKKLKNCCETSPNAKKKHILTHKS